MRPCLLLLGMLVSLLWPVPSTKGEPTMRSANTVEETAAGWVKYADNPVLGGSLGTCFDVSVLKESGRFRMWFSWRPKASVALTESPDGIHWSAPRIVLGPNPETNWEADINRPTVLKRGRSYAMWYTGQANGNSWIGYATSPDGVTWMRQSKEPALSPEAPWEGVAVMCPHVLWDAATSLYKMWYSGGEQYEPNAIGYATSPDGLHWTKYPTNPIFIPDKANPWEQDRVTACQVISTGGWYWMFYIGFEDESFAQIGLARSRDGITGWERHPANPILRARTQNKNAWDYDAVYKPFALFDAGRWMLWYNGRRGSTEQIGLALHSGKDLWRQASSSRAGLSGMGSDPKIGSDPLGADWPQTRAERTDYQETSHYEDVLAFFRQMQRKGAPILVEMIGESAKGRPIPLVIASRPLVSTPAEARRSGKPIVYVEANIHGGEVEGKEAIQMLLRQWSQEPSGGMLDKFVFVVTPIYNIDGNESWGPGERNRPEQDGPAIVGERANGQGLDLNRDAIKAEAPEMRAALEHIYTRWDPDVVIDLHTTDGTRQGYELTYAPPLNPDTEPDILHFCRDELLPAVRRQLRKQFGMETFDYGNAEPRTGGREWHTFGQEGRYVTNYAGLRNRISILSEATTYLPFKDRVVATERFIQAILNTLARNPSRVVNLTRAADARVTEWGLHPEQAPELGVRFEMASRGEEMVLLEKPPASSATRPTGRPQEVVKVRMPVYDRFTATRTARFPAAYLIPGDQSAVVALLRRHGIVVERTLESWTGEVQEFAITEVDAAPRPFQGHALIRLEGQFHPSRITLAAGNYVVRTAQPLGILAFHILEPESLDGAATWGFLGEALQTHRPYPIYKALAPVLIPTERLSR